MPLKTSRAIAFDATTELPLQSLVDERLIRTGSASIQPAGSGSLAGPFRGKRHGQGLDFDDLRPYTEGDDPRHIDWKVSARTNLTHTRLYREEKDHTLSVALDLRMVMFNGSNILRAVNAGRLAARLIWHASAKGSRVQLHVLHDEGIKSTRARTGENSALDACGLISEVFEDTRALAASMNKTDSTIQSATLQTQTLDVLLAYMRRQPQKLGSQLLLSGMDDKGSQFDQRLASLAIGNRFAAVMLDDPMLIQGLPQGRYAWRSNKGKQQITIDSHKSKVLRKRLTSIRSQLQEGFAQKHIPLAMSTSELLATLKDIQEPLPPEATLPWLILANIGIALCILGLLVYRWWRARRAWRVEALANIKASRTLESHDAMSSMATTLRRVLLRSDGQQINSLSGKAWLERLDQRFDTKWFTEAEGVAFGQALYAPCQLSDSQLNALRDQLTTFIQALDNRTAPAELVNSQSSSDSLAIANSNSAS